MVWRSHESLSIRLNIVAETMHQPPLLTLYYREGCHLCEDMEQQLQELLDPESFRLQRRDIDEDPALQNLYNVRVPVLECAGVELCEHFLDLQAVSDALQRSDAGYNRATT